MHFGPKRHRQERDAQAPHRFVETRPGKHLGRRRRRYAAQTQRSLKSASQDGLSLPGRGTVRLADAVRESCASLARLTTKSPAEIDFAVNDVLRQVELEGDQGKLPSDLSGGMRKRAGLARALVLEPKVLLADEPSSGLDRITASEIDELLLRQKRDKGMTILVVTHDVHGARRVGDRFAVLDKGDLIAYGTATEVENSGRDTARKLITEDYPA